MRTLLVLFACAAAALVAAGCSDDNTCAPCPLAVSDTPLGQMSIIMGGQTSSTFTDTLRINFVSSSADTLFDMFVTPADDKTTEVIRSKTYHPFAAAAARLSDGVNDVWTFNVRTTTGPMVGDATTETGWLHGGFTGDFTPDLHGAEITRAWIYLNDVTITQVAGYTQYSLNVSIIVMGTI